MSGHIVLDVEGFFKVIHLKQMRHTQGVTFDVLPLEDLGAVNSIDRVVHDPGAFSPGTIRDVTRPWYMHTAQADHLLVLEGKRYVELYHPTYGRIESFVATAQAMEHNGELVWEGAAFLCWPEGVFHRVISCEKHGSISMNFAIHKSGYDIRTNFNIYDLNSQSGDYHVIREGHLDQTMGE